MNDREEDPSRQMDPHLATYTRLQKPRNTIDM